jgi:Ni,Fe-hydrogenase III small subunit
MIKLFLKIFRTPQNIIPITPANREQTEVIAIGEKIQENVKRLFKGSLAIRQIDAGSDNACEQELVALSNAFYDVERFGIHFVASPKHADMLLVTGPVTRNMVTAVKRTYEATPEPKIVVAVGDDAIHGGLYAGSYAVLDGVHAVLPVHYHIPGDPPSPLTILYHLLNILQALPLGVSHQKAR